MLYCSACCGKSPFIEHMLYLSSTHSIMHRLASVTAGVAGQATPDAGVTLLQTQLLLESLAKLRVVLLTPLGDRPAHRVCTDRNDRPAPLSSVWIRRTCAFLQIVGCVVVPLLQQCAQNVPSAVTNWEAPSAFALPKFLMLRKRRRRARRTRTSQWRTMEATR